MDENGYIWLNITIFGVCNLLHIAGTLQTRSMKRGIRECGNRVAREKIQAKRGSTMKKTVKSTAAILSLTLGLSGFLPVANIANPSAHASDYIGSGSSSSDEYIVLGSYYLSKDQVKHMASVMRGMTSGGATIAETLIGFLGGGATVVMAATALSANAQLQTEVLYAADHNMRVHVVIKDKKMHTSYSTVVTYTAVK